MKTILVAQGGGPTAVINRSLAGVIETAQECGATRILGAIHGVRGIIEERFYRFEGWDKDRIRALGAAPGAALGSTRDKPDGEYCRRILDVCRKHGVDALFYIGGNDSAGAMAIIEAAKSRPGDPPLCVHVPKTIDNDLVDNDHTPGYPSAARFVALAFAGIDCDGRALPGVHIGVTMGRHAGFLTAAAAMARGGPAKSTGRPHPDRGPHIICLPEIPFRMDDFLARVDRVYQRSGRCLIAVSEGIADDKGRPIATTLQEQTSGGKKGADAFGNVQLSGTGALGDMLANEIQRRLKIPRVRADTFGYIQRCFPEAISHVDAAEAHRAGVAAVKLADSGRSGSMTLVRKGDRTIFVPAELEAIGGKTRLFPKEWITPFDVDDAFIDWLAPLLGDPLPRFAHLPR